MAKDPAFLFYTNDFLSGTQFLSDDQLGKYMRLLLAQHQHGHLTEDQVIFICKSYDNHIMSKLKKDDKGLWYNERLEIEIEKRKNYVESRSKNKEGKTKQKNMSESYENHMVNKDRNKDKNEIINDNATFSDYEEWTEVIISDKDWMFNDKLKNMGIQPNGQLTELARSHLALLAKYPKMQPTDQNRFRLSLIGHIQEKLKENGNSKPNKTTPTDTRPKEFRDADYSGGLRKRSTNSR